MKRFVLIVASVGLLSLPPLVSQPVRAEFYLGGQIGASLPQPFENAQGEGRLGLGPSSNATSINMTNSLLFGAKAGYFLPASLSLDWIGLEADLYYSTPHLKHQSYTLDGAGIGQGVLLRMTTLATRLVIRSPSPKPEDLLKPDVGLWERSQPYIGLGPAIFFTKASTGSGSATDTAVGVSLQAGWRLFLTGQTALFAEYKLDNGALAFTNVFGANTKLQGDYTAHNLVLGLSYHFNQ